MLKNRCNPLNLDDFEGLDKKRRELLQESEALKSQRNTVSKEISVMKKNKEDAEAKILEMRAVGAKISELDKELKDVEAQLRDIMLHIPNMPREDVPIGKDDTENPEVRKWGEPTKFDFEPKAHWDLGTELDILDADRAAKVTGARFTFYKGLGARLERACINFMMDLHANKHGYTEMLAPYIANKESMTGTGQLPKFADDMFKLEGLDYYLVPTAEVPTTNYHRDEILDGNKLPEYYSCYTACFRAEAGSAGRDTRGLIRQHQFNKVELIKFVKPETSWHELDTMVDAAEDVLRLLELPYHVVKLCTGDMSFTSARRTTSRSGSPHRTSTARSPRARTARTIRRAAPTSSSAAMPRASRSSSTRSTARASQSAARSPRSSRTTSRKTARSASRRSSYRTWAASKSSRSRNKNKKCCMRLHAAFF